MKIEHIRSIIQDATIDNTVSDSDYTAIMDRLPELKREKCGLTVLFMLCSGALLLIPDYLMSLSTVIFGNSAVLFLSYCACAIICIICLYSVGMIVDLIGKRFSLLSQQEKMDLITINGHPSPEIAHYFDQFKTGTLRRPFMKIDYDIVQKGVVLLADRDLDNQFSQIINKPAK